MFDFIRWVSEIKPKVVLMENVAGFLTISKPFLREVGNRYRSAGYDIDIRLLCSADYGVPQLRNRVFCFAVRDNGRVILEPRITHSNLLTLFGSMAKYTTVGTALHGLPEPTRDGVVEVIYHPRIHTLLMESSSLTLILLLTTWRRFPMVKN